jgi:hypothetical protein
MLSIFPVNLITTPNCSQFKTLVRTKIGQMSFPEMVSESLCRNDLGVETHSFIRWLVSDVPASEET